MQQLRRWGQAHGSFYEVDRKPCTQPFHTSAHPNKHHPTHQCPVVVDGQCGKAIAFSPLLCTRAAVFDCLQHCATFVKSLYKSCLRGWLKKGGHTCAAMPIAQGLHRERARTAGVVTPSVPAASFVAVCLLRITGVRLSWAVCLLCRINALLAVVSSTSTWRQPEQWQVNAAGVSSPGVVLNRQA